MVGKPKENARFWEVKTLKEMSREEWESLCDGCGRCCLNKIEFTDTKEIHYTRLACQLLDLKSCRCSQYAERQTLVPDCIVLSPSNLCKINYLPPTCAYRLLSEGKPLEMWHPLISGTRDSIHQAGISVRGKVESEIGHTDLEEHLITWIPPVKSPKTRKKSRSKRSP